ncbi:hypothetical protein [Photobacterium lipolyticum]|nr:hypothetical protein [Photobacterium lipolyticum]
METEQAVYLDTQITSRCSVQREFSILIKRTNGDGEAMKVMKANSVVQEDLWAHVYEPG